MEENHIIFVKTPSIKKKIWTFEGLEMNLFFKSPQQSHFWMDFCFFFNMDVKQMFNWVILKMDFILAMKMTS
jgi:hypothetical protein